MFVDYTYNVWLYYKSITGSQTGFPFACLEVESSQPLTIEIFMEKSRSTSANTRVHFRQTYPRISRMFYQTFSMNQTLLNPRLFLVTVDYSGAKFHGKCTSYLPSAYFRYLS